ncbi:MAG: phytanoyl-CoA dioxygenase family protein [Planctomycetes bacterium]|nr:phytanoyl-CoA dioxygenase family protein [Planctomycetota bacterium]MCB9888725.1 phytanoyl-CoA dioxygenase family protein [Planctomycetota bacterium]
MSAPSGAYPLTPEQIEAFRRDGYVHLRGVLSAAELQTIEPDYQRLIRGEIEVPGKDYCDMSGDYGRDPEDYSIINVMLPRRYCPALQGSVLEQRAASIAAQLCGPDMVLDYDQLLAKRPHKPDAVFAWHQDMAYWPDTPDTRTATIWLALDDATEANGCMRFVPGSHREASLRPHHPLHGDRSVSHTLVTEVDEKVDRVRLAEIARGDATVHSERVLHGSGGNTSDRWRRAYVIAFRSAATVAEERRRGFTHSHNDSGLT